MPRKKEYEESPFELTAELGDNTDETTPAKKREIPLRQHYHREKVTKKSVETFFNGIDEIYTEDE